VQQAFKKMALVPKHEFEAQEALLTTLEAQVAHLESRLRVLESAEPTDVGKPN
jgi:BMFP domain-containing protein YqiC